MYFHPGFTLPIMLYTVKTNKKTTVTTHRILSNNRILDGYKIVITTFYVRFSWLAITTATTNFKKIFSASFYL